MGRRRTVWLVLAASLATILSGDADVEAFQPLLLDAASRSPRSTSVPVVLGKKGVPEFSVIGDEGDEEARSPVQEEEDRPPEDVFTRDSPAREVRRENESSSSSAATVSSGSGRLQYAAMEPGTVLQIQVGDVSLARKAWKKRRRSGSPLLVPCSVLAADRESSVRWNLMYLLEKFGGPAPAGRGRGVISLSQSELSRRHGSHLKSSLRRHCGALGRGDSAGDLLRALFPRGAQDSYGVRLVEDGEGSLRLESFAGRSRARKRAGQAAVLEFTPDPGRPDLLRHTGYVRLKRDADHRRDDGNIYYARPLSAALRVGREDVDAGRVFTGSTHAAVVFDFDAAGDAGAPLLTLALDPSRNRVRERFLGRGGFVSAAGEDRSAAAAAPVRPEDVRVRWSDLSVGTGPLEGTVVRLTKTGAWVDCGIGRSLGGGGGEERLTKVYGFLNFRDAVRGRKSAPGQEVDSDKTDDDDWDEIFYDEDQIEEEEDVTHLYLQSDDGSLLYTDPETGKTQVLGSLDDETEEGQEVSDDTDDATAESSASYRYSVVTTPPTMMKSQRLHVGDRIKVYVKSASRQNKQIMFTMDRSIQGKKAKELKRESAVNKKLSRLAKQFGGLHRIQQLQGRECNGVVKATSRDRLYVQPEDENLPVGVATCTEEVAEAVQKGDAVRIQLEGVDEDRGQLAIHVIRKLAP
jgi:hypothetical protein